MAEVEIEGATAPEATTGTPPPEEGGVQIVDEAGNPHKSKDPARMLLERPDMLPDEEVDRLELANRITEIQLKKSTPVASSPAVTTPKK